MNKIHTIDHIRTPRMLKSFRACVNMTGKSQILADYGRFFLEEYRRYDRMQEASGQRILIRGRSQ